jgi:ribosomal protein S18 acetylase RimI-like enzyme
MRFETTIPGIDQFWQLFQTTNWNTEYQLSPEELTNAVRHNWYAVAAYEGEQLVGFGRVATDGILHAMIYDLIVSPSHQGQGVGTQIRSSSEASTGNTGSGHPCT